MPVSLLLGLVAFGSSFNSQGAVLERRAVVGEVSKMRLSVQIDMQGNTASFSALVVEKISSVEPNGDYVLESRQTEARSKYGDVTTNIPDGLPRQANYRSNGELLSIKTDSANPADIRVSRMNAFISPGREVKVGESWTYEFKGTPQSGGLSGKSEFKIESTEKLGEKTVWVVRYSFRESAGTPPASSSGKMWIDPENGRLMRLESEWQNAPVAGAPGPLNAKVTISREA